MEAQKAIDYILKKLKSGLSTELKYHSYQHTLKVIEAAKTIGQAEGINDTEMSILLTAAAYHDCGFLYVYEDHETASCHIVQEILPSFGFDEKAISKIIKMIMAGKVPQSPRNKLEMILCDADLDYLGGDQYDSTAALLFEELNLNGFKITEPEWLDLQVSFLTSHRYWTDFSVKNRRPDKLDVLQRLKKQKKAF